MRNDEKNKRALSVRLPPETMSTYSQLIEGAGITISENIRTLVDGVLMKSATLDLSMLRVDFIFKWREPDPKYQFPEHVGSLLVNVSLPTGMSAEDLSCLVFIIPEFFDGTNEPFRIDSYHFHRVCNDRIWVASTRVHRNVLSFRLIEGKWRAAIFDYTGGTDRKVLESKIKTALHNHIHSTIVCGMLGLLSELRVLTQAEREHYDGLLLPHLLVDE